MFVRSFSKAAKGFHSSALVHELNGKVKIFQFLVVPAQADPHKFELLEIRDGGSYSLGEPLPLDKATKKASQHFSLRHRSLTTAGGALREDPAFIPADSRFSWESLEGV